MTTTTAAQRREEAKLQFDVFLATCPSRQLLDRISNKWVTLILCALSGGGPQHHEAGDGDGPRPLRYSQLSRMLAGVSQKMLTQTLRSLERDGLVSRTVTATVPVTVTYELTDLGRSLVEAVRPLKQWAEAHIATVLTNREAYDAQASRPSVP